MDNIEEILEGVKILNRLGRDDDSIKMMDTFLEEKQDLDKNERTIFFVVYKTAIDSSRASYRTIDAYHQQCLSDGATGKANKLQYYKELVGTKIIDQAQKAIDIIDSILIPHAEGPAALAFYYKMKGDMYRYIAETSLQVEKQYGTIEGQTAYQRAIEICEQNLSPIDPVRLGTILNSAVFRYEHLKEKGEAFEILQHTVQEVRDHLSEAPPEDQNEISSAYNTMLRNISIWEVGGEQEEEEKAEND
ncbi:14-3-3 protein [Trichomonas vaginalis G3]|uniref:14-3-3 protein n=1 Tax=Trichomonas vaginalis (strain ATCC PRA-98 / G3) TaxID=412133 RepID=A2E4R6_TRIV3|nr:protein domain specific binding [Trichomonas vaginalis G3]EAY12376.1 14-3-3 protein [Trichomonas vaginalis G3]KAI5500794.1 protein domain specific binding [Trichomonas vaginalis G3]|eukprot:XP_001324599.1 14-3-3 protein [Trichomonas vaginalis G3]